MFSHNFDVTNHTNRGFLCVISVVLPVSHYVTEKVTGLEVVWFLGDNFAATTYRKYYLNRSQTYKEGSSITFEDYISSHYDYHMQCNSRFNSSTENMLVRIQNTLAGAVNKSIALPKYIIVILDDDLITYLDYKGVGVGELLGEWLRWLMTEIEVIIKARKDQLPVKVKRDMEPCIYWCISPTHVNFSAQRNDLRKKLNFCLESLLKNRENMRILKLKKSGISKTKHWSIRTK